MCHKAIENNSFLNRNYKQILYYNRLDILMESKVQHQIIIYNISPTIIYVGF